MSHKEDITENNRNNGEKKGKFSINIEHLII